MIRQTCLVLLIAASAGVLIGWMSMPVDSRITRLFPDSVERLRNNDTHCGTATIGVDSGLSRDYEIVWMKSLFHADRSFKQEDAGTLSDSAVLQPDRSTAAMPCLKGIISTNSRTRALMSESASDTAKMFSVGDSINSLTIKLITSESVELIDATGQDHVLSLPSPVQPVIKKTAGKCRFLSDVFRSNRNFMRFECDCV
jgi:hypothetical protein